MAETSTELSGAVTTVEFTELLHQLPDTVALMGQLGIRSVLRFSVPEELTLTIVPNSPISGEDHKISKVGGSVTREFDSRMRRTSSPFRVISFIVANPGDVPGEGNNMMTYGVKRSGYSTTRQRLCYFNLFDHAYEIVGTATPFDPDVPAVHEAGFSWVTNFPDSTYPDNFIDRGLDLS